MAILGWFLVSEAKIFEDDAKVKAEIGPILEISTSFLLMLHFIIVILLCRQNPIYESIPKIES